MATSHYTTGAGWVGGCKSSSSPTTWLLLTSLWLDCCCQPQLLASLSQATGIEANLLDGVAALSYMSSSSPSSECSYAGCLKGLWSATRLPGSPMGDAGKRSTKKANLKMCGVTILARWELPVRFHGVSVACLTSRVSVFRQRSSKLLQPATLEIWYH